MKKLRQLMLVTLFTIDSQAPIEARCKGDGNPSIRACGA